MICGVGLKISYSNVSQFGSCISQVRILCFPFYLYSLDPSDVVFLISVSSFTFILDLLGAICSQTLSWDKDQTQRQLWFGGSWARSSTICLRRWDAMERRPFLCISQNENWAVVWLSIVQFQSSSASSSFLRVVKLVCRFSPQPAGTLYYWKSTTLPQLPFLC